MEATEISCDSLSNCIFDIVAYSLKVVHDVSNNVVIRFQIVSLT